MIYLGFVQSQISYNTHHFDGSHFFGQNILLSDWLTISVNHRVDCVIAYVWPFLFWGKQIGLTQSLNFKLLTKSFHFSDWSKIWPMENQWDGNYPMQNQNRNITIDFFLVPFWMHAKRSNAHDLFMSITFVTFTTLGMRSSLNFKNSGFVATSSIFRVFSICWL